MSNSTAFVDSNISSRGLSSSGLADNMNRNKPLNNITTQLHTPLPRPGGVSTPTNTSMNTANTNTNTNTNTSATSMEAVNRSRSVVDPLASMSTSDDADEYLINSEEEENHNNSPEIKETPVDMYTNHFLSKISSPPINVGLISRNISGLHILASCNAWKQVIELSMELLQGNPLNAFTDDQTLSVVFIFRMIGLFRLKMLDELQQENSAVLAIEESNLLTHLTGMETVIDADKGGMGTFLGYLRPSTTSFRVDTVVSLQLLYVEVKVVTGHGDEALNLLYLLKQWLSSPPSPEDSATASTHTNTSARADSSSGRSVGDRVIMWKWKVVWSLVNVLLRQRLWRQGIKEMISMLDEVQRLKTECSTPPGSEEQDTNTYRNKYSCAEILILCRIARTLIQMGALQSAGSYLDKATALFSACGERPESMPDAVLETHIDVTRGLLCFSNDQFVEACDLFQGVMDSAINTRSMGSTGNFLLDEARDSSGGDEEQEGEEEEGGVKRRYSRCPEISLLAHPCAGVVEMEESLLAIAVNNFAVCSLHLRRIKAAVSKMEELVQDDPSRHMVDPVIFNLCTMYDLSFGPIVSTEKKKTLQLIAEKYNIDDLSWRSFRLN